MRVCAIIVAAGSGKRFGSRIPKQFHVLGKKPVLAHVLYRFDSSPIINGICLVVKKKAIEMVRKKIVQRYNFKKVCMVIGGGKERQDSVYNGLINIGDNWDVVMVHDGVRPFINDQLISKVAKAAMRCGAAIPGIKVRDTVKAVNDYDKIVETVNRENLWLAQTPQAFRYEILKKSYEKARREKYTGTDDAMLVEKAGYKVIVIEGLRSNIKITTAEDLRTLILLSNG